MRVLFYDDATDFGGHELQTLAAARYMALQPGMEVGFMYFRGNVRLSKQLADSAAHNSCFKPLPQDYASRPLQFVRTLVSGSAIRRIATEMTEFAPDVIVIAQGAIALCSAGLMAAKKIGLPAISYVPMTHPERFFSKSRLKAVLREPVNRIYYRLPDEYITINQRMERYLRRKGLTQPVTVVQAAIDLAEWQSVERTAARESLGLTAGDWVVALIGRVQFWQKQQDLAVRALALARSQVPNLKLLLVGDGPDLGALKELVHSEGVEDIVVFAGWTDSLSVVYSAIDVLVIPSRYEGLPLVMLQAMYFGKPVIASAVDGMLDILPPQWLFECGDSAALAARLVEASRANETALLEAQREMVIRDHSLPVFEQAFMVAVISATDRIRRGSRDQPAN